MQTKKLYGESLVKCKKREVDISTHFSLLSQEIKQLLEMLKIVCERTDINVYIVGGFCRDLLLGKENKDLDIIVDGNIYYYLKNIAYKLERDFVYHHLFQTGSIQYQGFNLDFSLPRKENYPEPGALPEIEKTSIEIDSFRRDYTINTLLLPLDKDKYSIIDFFNACQDLEEGQLRVLHTKSFLHDPTRIIRGIRLALKLGFQFEERTHDLALKALDITYPALNPGRVLKEIKQLFTEKINPRTLNLIGEYQFFKLLGFDVDITEKDFHLFSRLEAYLDYYREKNYNIKEWLLRLALLLRNDQPNNIKNWDLKKEEISLLTFKIDDRHRKILTRRVDPFELYNFLSQYSVEEILFTAVMFDNAQVSKNIEFYLEKLARINIKINGYDLQEMGLEPGKKIQQVLDKVHRAKIKGQLADYRDEIAYARKIINEME